jgi:hypothetical protein
MKRTTLVGLALVTVLAVTPTAALAGPPRGRPPAPRQHRPAIGWFFRWLGHRHGHYQPPPPQHNRGRHHGWQQGRHNGRERGRRGGWNEPGENGGHNGGGRGHGGR